MMDDVVTWTVWPARAHPVRTALVGIFLAGVLAVLLIFYGKIWFLLGLLLFILTLNAYFVPSRYRLDQETILVDRFFYRNRHDWKTFRGCYPTKNGVVVSPLPHHSWRNSFRGVHLLLPAEPERSAILAYIKSRFPSEESKTG